MTVDQMLARLAERLEDSTGAVFTSANRLTAINDQTLELCKLVDTRYLDELEVIDSNKSLTAGALALSGLTETVLADGIQKVKIYEGTYCDLFKGADKLEQWALVQDNTYLTASTASPYAMVNDSKIYVLPSDTSAIDVYYLKQPDTVAAGGNFEISAELQVILLDMSEAYLWESVNRPDRAERPYSRAMNMVQALNERAV